MESGFAGSADHMSNESIRLPARPKQEANGEVIMTYKIALSIIAALALAGVTTGAIAVDSFFAIPAMPEPGDWSMILAGLGMIGVIISRRRGNSGL
jgi:hypothetical protein